MTKTDTGSALKGTSGILCYSRYLPHLLVTDMVLHWPVEAVHLRLGLMLRYRQSAPQSTKDGESTKVGRARGTVMVEWEPERGDRKARA